MQNLSSDTVKQALIYSVMFRYGIIPMEDPYGSVIDSVANTDPVIARQMKRRFRKVWRRMCAAELKRAWRLGHETSRSDADKEDEKKFVKREMIRQCGLGQLQPSPKQLAYRRELVYAYMIRVYVFPILRQIKNPGERGKISCLERLRKSS